MPADSTLRTVDDVSRVARRRVTASVVAASFPPLGSALVILMGVALLVREWLNLSGRTEARSEPSAVALVTAAGLAISGSGVLLIHWHRSSRRRAALVAARLAALATIAFGLIVLGQHSAAWLVTAAGRAPLVPGGAWWMSRPAPSTAIGITLIGIAALAVGTRREYGRRWSGWAAAAVLIISLTALVGHAYGASLLYGFSGMGGMSVSTAVALCVLALAIVCIDPEQGVTAVFVSDTAGGRLLRRLVPAAILIPTLLGWLRLRAERLGIVDTAFGLAMLVVVLVVIFVGLLVSQAAGLHAFDTERARLHTAERAARADAEAARLAAERARREADEANKAKSAFLATMSHEVRTPINAIVGYTQLMELGIAGPITEQQREYLARLAATSEHLQGLVNDILDLAKIDAGGMTVAREDGLTGALVAAALDLVRPQASARGVRLVDGWPGEPGKRFVGDEHRVRQILANLLSNAVKFTEPGGTVTVTCGTVSETPPVAGLRGDGPWTFIQVADTGIGIARDEQTRIFEPFHQVDRGHTRRQGGTGLGLAISLRLAHLMAGDLTVESTPGLGSTFTLWLPAPATDAVRGGESAAERGARARHEPDAERVHGLAEVGTYLRERIEDVIAAYAARLRVDPMFPQTANLRRSEVEDHQLSFLGDIAQTLVVVEDTGGPDSDLLRDGSTIQRVIAELHGAMRQRRGWTEAQLEREYAILGEEVAAAVRRRVPDGTGDVSLALEVLARLLDRACANGLAALRRGAETENARTG